MRLFAAVAALALVGCSAEAEPAPEPHAYAFDPSICAGHWHVDRASFARLAPDGLQAIEASPASWDRFSAKPGSLSFDDAPAATCTIRIALGAEVPEETATGRYNATTGNIVLIVDRMPPCADVPWSLTCLGPVILHEIGHGMGMPHIDDADHGIMNAHVMNAWFTRADRRLCEKTLACAPDAAWIPANERMP